jgi:hypothetical protein
VVWRIAAVFAIISVDMTTDCASVFSKVVSSSLPTALGAKKGTTQRDRQKKIKT